MVTRLLLNRFLLAASLLAVATPCGVPGTDAPPLTGLCTDTEWATAIVLPRSLLPGGVSGSSKSCTPENGLCLFQDKDLSVTRVEGVAGGTTIEIGSSGCPNHPIESGKATAAPVKTKTNYIEVAGSLTFLLVSSASAFTCAWERREMQPQRWSAVGRSQLQWGSSPAHSQLQHWSHAAAGLVH